MEANMALNEIRPNPTLDSLLSQAHNLLDNAINNRRDLEALANEVCGSAPETAEPAELDRPANGKLDVLANVLEMICIHQDNARVMTRRLECSLGNQPPSVSMAGMGSSKASY
jgi:hypothetical protein